MYDVDFKEQGDLKLHVRKFFLYPDYWKERSNSIGTSLNWRRVKFNKSNTKNIPQKEGVYCFVVIPTYKNFFEIRYLFYVGMTKRTLYERYCEYLDEQGGKGKPRKKIFEMLKLYSDCLYFYYANIQKKSFVKKCETILLNTFVPPINTDIPKAKIKPELKNIYE